MKILITFSTNEKLAFYTLIQCPASLIKALATPETVTANDKIIEPNPNNLYIFNRCYRLLKVDEAGLTPASTITFIDEASENKKYCSLAMLYALKDYLFLSLNGFADTTNRDIKRIKNGAFHSLTPEEIKNIHKSINAPLRDTYICESNDITCLLIQIIYATLYHFFKHNKIIKRCKFCGSLFVPERTNNDYCERLINGKTCKQNKELERVKNSQEKEPASTKRKIYNILFSRGAKDTLNDFMSGYADCKSFAEQMQYLETWKERLEIREYKKRKPPI